MRYPEGRNHNLRHHTKDETRMTTLNKIAYFDCLKGPRAQKMKATSYHVLMLLYDYSSGDGTNAHPGTERLARECGVSTRAVETALAQLVERGFIRVERPGGGSGYATVYRLTNPEQIFGVTAENHERSRKNPERSRTKTPNKSSGYQTKYQTKYQSGARPSDEATLTCYECGYGIVSPFTDTYGRVFCRPQCLRAAQEAEDEARKATA